MTLGVPETATINGHWISSLDIISIVALLCGITIIISKNPIMSLMFLIGLFGTISMYLILVKLSFIGLAYLIVYIGAVSILFLFILMLINIRTSELQSNNINSIALGLYITLLLANFILFPVLPYDLAILNNYNNSIGTMNQYLNLLNPFGDFVKRIHAKIMFISSNSWDGNMADTSHISAIGNILYTSHNMWIFMASFILLLSMVGAIIITIKTEGEN